MRAKPFFKRPCAMSSTKEIKEPAATFADVLEYEGWKVVSTEMPNSPHVIWHTRSGG